MKTRVSIFGWLATVVMASGALGFDVSAKGDEKEGLGGIAEDIEIMQRLLGKALSQHYGGSAGRGGDADLRMAPRGGRGRGHSDLQDDKEDVALRYALAINEYASLTAQPGRFNVAGYYVAGVGAMFTFNLPVSLKEAESPSEGEEVKIDLWSQTEDEVRGTHHAGPRIAGAWSRKKMVLNESALDESIDVLLEAVGKFGLRIEGLSTSDSIVLAASLEGAGVTAWANELSLNIARGHFATALSSGAYRVTLRIPVSAIREFADGGMDLQSLRERSEITRYQIPTTPSSGGYSR